jgi:methyltransferase (TIGR00027 family)
MTQTPRLPAGVGLTALGAARGRASESARPDHLIDDPFAACFLAAAGDPRLPSDTTTVDLRPIINAYVGIRTRYFDDALLAATAAGIRQVLILGAGLDARAFRLTWPSGTRVYEADVADVFTFKEPILRAAEAQARCARVVVAQDLRGDWPRALGQSGFDAAQPSVWLLEGLLMYLTEAERDRLLGHIEQLSAPGSRLALEPAAWTVPHELAPTVAMGQASAALIDSLLNAGQAAVAEASVADPAAWLNRHGWRACVQPAAELFVAYGRPVPQLLHRLRRYLATAERVELSA